MTSLKLLVPIPALSLALSLLSATSVLSAQEATNTKKVDFVRDIQPILKSRCWECHGIDEQEGDLRLDLKSSAFPEDEDLWSILPGEPNDSEFLERILLPEDDPDIMPEEGGPLTKAQIALLTRWIEEGAVWPESADKAVIEAEKKAHNEYSIELKPLDAAGIAKEEKCIESIIERGAHAMKVAADTEAVDVNFSLLGAKTKDADIELLDGLQTNLIWLNLSRTGISDAALKGLAAFPELRRLNLSKTAITDAGLAHLSKLEHLDYLNLYGTKVTNKGIGQLRLMKKLSKLYVWQTAVTKRGTLALKHEIPGLHIDLGEHAKLVTKTTSKIGGAMINKICPVSGKPAKTDKVVLYQGKTIGLCCDKCLAKWKKDPAKYASKVTELKTKLAPKKVAPKQVAAAKNSICPVSGKPIDASKTSTLDGVVVAFCCGKCKKSFDANPEKYRAKIPALAGKN